MSQAARTISLLTRLTKKTEGFDQLFTPGKVCVCLGAEVATKPQAQMIFSFAVNLLARLYPVVQELQVLLPQNTHLTARVPRWSAETLDGHIDLFLQKLSPQLKQGKSYVAGVPTVTLVIGSAVQTASQAIFLGSDGWQVYVSPTGPVEVGDNANPVGAYSAACFGVAEVSKRLLYPHRELFSRVPIFPLKQTLSFSSFTYRVGSAEPNPPLPPDVDLSRLTVAGLGAGGGASMFTIASLREIRGAINLVEPDEVVESNLNRYVYAELEDALRRRPKVEIVKGFLHGFTRLNVKAFPVPFGEAISHLSPEDYKYVLAAVHSREARRELQYETPMVIWDAGAAEDGEFRLWRMILGTTECMWCKHPPTERDPERDKARQLAALLGLDVNAWLRKIRSNEAFKAEEISFISAHLNGKNQSFELPVEGQRYGDWEADQCGRLPLPDTDDDVPIPFAPVMAGVLLAGEVIKEFCFPDAVLDACYWNTLIGRFMERNQPFRRSPLPNCSFCHDGTYLAQYKRRWES